MHSVRYVPGAGHPRSNIMIVGEAPGEQEILEGKPFVGASGKLLDEALKKIGWQRESLYITNVVKVRPANNRTPTLEEMNSWLPVLLDEITTVDPCTILLMGASATRILDSTLRVSIDHGQSSRIDINRTPYWIAPMFHPSYILRGYGSKEMWFKDFESVKYETGM